MLGTARAISVEGEEEVEGALAARRAGARVAPAREEARTDEEAIVLRLFVFFRSGFFRGLLFFRYGVLNCFWFR